MMRRRGCWAILNVFFRLVELAVALIVIVVLAHFALQGVRELTRREARRQVEDQQRTAFPATATALLLAQTEQPPQEASETPVPPDDSPTASLTATVTDAPPTVELTATDTQTSVLLASPTPVIGPTATPSGPDATPSPATVGNEVTISSATPLPTHTASATATPSPTASSTPTMTPTITHTRTWTATWTATQTPTPTASATLTATATTTPSLTPSRTRTATATRTPSPTRSIAAPPPTNTRRPSRTPTLVNR